MKWLFTDNDFSLFNIKMFSLNHLLLVLVCACLVVLGWFVMRKKSQKAKWIFICTLVGITVFYKLFNLIYWGFFNPDNLAILTGEGTTQNIARWLSIVIPTSLCSINVIMMPIALKLKKPVWYQYLFTISMLGAVMTFILLTGQPPRPWHWVEFFLTHLIYIAAPIYLVTFGFYRPSLKLVPRMTVFFIAFLFVNFCFSLLMNLTLNSQFETHYITMRMANDYKSLPHEWLYNNVWTMFSDDTPILKQIFGILPIPFLYQFLLVPLVMILWGIILIPFHSKEELRGMPKAWGEDIKSWFKKGSKQ